MGGLPPITDQEWHRCQKAIQEHKGNITLAAASIGVKRQTLQSRILTQRARKMMPDGLPLDGYNVKGTSTLYDSEGEIKATWVKTNVDQARQEEIVRETIAALAEAIKPIKPTASPKDSTDDLCVNYIIGDAHIGLYSWAPETGSDFDIKIACQDLTAAADRLVASTPASKEAMIVQLGDFYHIDDSRNITPRGGNQLDVDSRFPKVIRAGIDTLRHMIDRALRKHALVRVRNVAGNHDPHAAIALTEALRGYYINEPRVVIEDSPRAFWHFRFGSNLIGITHGHFGKPERYPGILAVDAQKDWGECEFRYVWHGHIHTRRAFEDMGVITESFRTLAARDAWHTEMGYRSGREMQAIVLHKDFGEIERHTAGLRRVRT